MYGLYRIKRILVEANTMHYQDIEDNEFLMNYKTAPEGLVYLDVSVRNSGHGGKTVVMKNNDGDYGHELVLLIGKE